MRLMPAPVNHGVVFRRIDIAGKPEIEAVADMVISTKRSTLLGSGETTVSTVEHLLSALFGLNIDNLLVEVDGPEIPILDGSAKPYADALTEDMIVEQSSPRCIIKIEKQLVCRDEESAAEIIIYPDDKFSIELSIDYKSDVLGVQEARYDEKSDFRREIAPAKTFVFIHELEPLIENDLIKGGDLDNAVVIAEKAVSGEFAEKLGRLFGISGVKSIPKGYVNEEIVIFDNECARHKLLDLMGDLFLAGGAIIGRVVVKKPGHKINTKAAKMIRDGERKLWKC